MTARYFKTSPVGNKAYISNGVSFVKVVDTCEEFFHFGKNQHRFPTDKDGTRTSYSEIRNGYLHTGIYFKTGVKKIFHVKILEEYIDEFAYLEDLSVHKTLKELVS